MRSISGEHAFDLSSPALEEDAEERHDTVEMKQEEILAMLAEMERDGLAPEERFGARDTIPPEDGSGVYARHDTLRPPPGDFGYAVNDE